MRGAVGPSALLLGLGLAAALTAAGCASVAEETQRRLALEVGQECAGRFKTIEITGFDPTGRVAFRGAQAERAPFLACYREVYGQRFRALVAPGRPVSLDGGPAQSRVPMRVVGERFLIPAVVNEQQRVVLLVDTGATKSLVRPAVLERLAISLSPDATRWPMTVVGGQRVPVPFTRLRSLRVGQMVVEDIDVGVYDALPQMPGVDGLLGADFLGHFKVTMDRRSQQLTLEPQ